MFDWELALRLLNASLCVLALWILGVGAFRKRGTWNVKTTDHWQALFGWVFLGLCGAIEAVARGISVGPSSILKLLVVAITLRALFRAGEVRAERGNLPWKKEE